MALSGGLCLYILVYIYIYILCDLILNRSSLVKINVYTYMYITHRYINIYNYISNYIYNYNIYILYMYNYIYIYNYMYIYIYDNLTIKWLKMKPSTLHLSIYSAHGGMTVINVIVLRSDLLAMAVICLKIGYSQIAKASGLSF